MIYNTLSEYMQTDPVAQKAVRDLENAKLRSIGIKETMDEVYVLTGAGDTIISFVRKKDLKTLKTMRVEDFINGKESK